MKRRRAQNRARKPSDARNVAPAPPVAIVTGASRGLGRGIAIHLAASGHSVAINYAGNAAAADETTALCRKNRADARQKFISFQADVGEADDRRRLVAETLSAFGRIDALVNNAGMGPRVRADLTETTGASFEEVLRVNLWGPFFLTQDVANYWLNKKPKPVLSGGFKVINVSSISAYTASVNRGEYCVSKAGLSMVTKLWAMRLAAHGIQVFEIRPGIMATDMTAGVRKKYGKLIADGLVPQMRWGTPDDVGRAVASILAGHFPFSTGAVINVDGGFHLSRL